MIKDITIGQYFPGNSVIHRLDSRVKLVLDILYLVILFTAQSYTGLLLGMLFMVMCYMLARIKLVMILKSVKPILPLMIFTGILNLFFVKGETPLFKWEFIEIYPEGVNTALFMLIRVITLIVGMSLLTYTTSPDNAYRRYRAAPFAAEEDTRPGARAFNDDDYCAAFHSDSGGGNGPR